MQLVNHKSVLSVIEYAKSSMEKADDIEIRILLVRESPLLHVPQLQDTINRLQTV